MLSLATEVSANKSIDIYYNKVNSVSKNSIKYKKVSYNDTYKSELDYLLEILFEMPFKNIEYNLSDVELLDYIVVDNELILNLSDDIKKYTSSSDAINVRNQIVESLVSIEGIDTVTIYVEGELSDIGGIYVIRDR